MWVLIAIVIGVACLGVMYWSDRQEGIERGTVKPRTTVAGRAWEVVVFAGVVVAIVLLALFVWEWMKAFNWSMSGKYQ